MSADLSPYLEQLRALPFVKRVEVDRPKRGDEEADVVLTLQTPSGKARYVVFQVKSAQLSRPLAQDIMSRWHRRSAEQTLLVSQYVPASIAEELADHGIQFIDAAGNQNLQVRDRYFSRTAGKRPTRTSASEHKSTQPTGYLVYFALLADPGLRDASVRTVAAAVGVSKSAVSNAVAKLEAQNVLVRRRAGNAWLDTRALLERWLVGYGEVVRPRMFLGGYRTREANPTQVERLLEDHMPANIAWALGGSAAGYRLTGHYRGETTVVHVAQPPEDLARSLPLARAEQNPSLVVLRARGPLLLQGAVPRTAHPLLVYTELLCTGDERAREAAAEVRDKHLGATLT